MFLLHVEARGYLPVQSPAYNPHSATKIAQDCQLEDWQLSDKSTQRWDRIRTLVRMVRSGDRSVGVPHYNGSLFAPDRFPGAKLLEEVEVLDKYVVPAIKAIAYDLDNSSAGLDYAGLQVGHLGAIYEALLALRLTRANEDLKYDGKGGVFRPLRAGETVDITVSELFYQTEKGERKAGGVYYTREEFVQHLLNYSLIPALEEHFVKIRETAKTDPKTAALELFEFSIVDPAMGSGHFLTTALDMMADRVEFFLADIGGLPAIRNQLDELRQGQDADFATFEDVDLLRRLILKRCIYGVDISPMAVEVANVTLWLASFIPGLALSYLGSNLKCGDSLIGVAGQHVINTSDVPLFAEGAQKAMDRAVGIHSNLVGIPDISPDEVHRSQELEDEVRNATAGLRRAFDLWTAEPLGLSKARETLELHTEDIISGRYERSTRVSQSIEQARNIAKEYAFFHWTLEFPHIFHADQPGFNVIVGNPPWEELTIEQLAFYALHEPGLRGVIDLAEQRQRIDELDSLDESIRRQFELRSRYLATKRRFFNRESGYFNQGVGDTDLYKLFCERYTYLVKPKGSIGIVLPSGTFVNKGSTKFRRWLFTQNKLRRLDTVLNRKFWAFPIHAQLSIVLLAAERSVPSQDHVLKTTGPSTNVEQFAAESVSQGISIPYTLITSNWEIPKIPSNRHAEILSKLKTGVNLKIWRRRTLIPSTRVFSMCRALRSSQNYTKLIIALNLATLKGSKSGRGVAFMPTNRMEMILPAMPTKMRYSIG